MIKMKKRIPTSISQQHQSEEQKESLTVCRGKPSAFYSERRQPYSLVKKALIQTYCKEPTLIVGPWGRLKEGASPAGLPRDELYR